MIQNPVNPSLKVEDFIRLVRKVGSIVLLDLQFLK